tara:strand:- start:8658 stop:8924 length:267 start_codon:yes stop_codon:yes gene_type:complete
MEKSEISFNAIVVSLAKTAAVYFGDVVDPATGKKTAVNLEAAFHAIEMVALLEQKTQGNLSEAETAFIQQVLHELRVRYRQATRGTEV